MKALFYLLFACLTVTIPLAGYAAQAASHDTAHHYATHFFEGHWSAMALPSVTVKAQTPKNLTLTLPDTLKKITGQEQFNLSRQSGTSWATRQNGQTVTFSMISDNSAILNIEGSGEKQHLNMFLYRDE